MDFSTADIKRCSNDQPWTTHCILKWERIILFSISALSCSFVIARILYLQITRGYGMKSIEGLFEKLVCILLLLDLICAIECIMLEYVVPHSTLDLSLFAIRAWVHALFYAQNFVIAFFISALIVGKKSVRYLNKLFTVSVSVMLGVSLVLPATLIYLILYTSWGADELVLLLSNEIPTIILTSVTAYVYYKTYHSIKHRVVDPRLVDSFLRIRRDVFLMAIMFTLRASIEIMCIVCADAYHYRTKFIWAQFVFFFQLGLTGFCDAVIFGRLFRKSRNHRYRSTDTKNTEDMTSECLLESMDVNPRPALPVASTSKRMIFTTTANLGGCSDVSKFGNIEAWIPAVHFDLYVIGLQECLVLDDLRKLIHNHLGGPSEYTMYGQEIGNTSLLHGMIALTIFAKTKDVESGAFNLVDAQVGKLSNGVNLVVTKVPNKGATGLAVRYHDQVMAFVTSHFASDSKGKKRVNKRNEDARRTLQTLVLAGSKEGFDLHFQHGHTVLLGDLNYRISGMTPVEALEHTVASSVWEKNRMGGDWREGKKYILRSSSNVSKESAKSLVWRSGGSSKNLEGLTAQLIEEKKEMSFMEIEMENNMVKMEEGREEELYESTIDEESAWEWVAIYDELIEARKKNQVLSSFHEHPITFPPSFRWQRDRSAGDYTDLEKLKASYTLAKKEGKKSASRCPSYTDRILIHSLPDLRPLLKVKHYDMCDAICVSDHRPVNAVLELTVDESFKGFRVKDNAGSEAAPAPSKGPSVNAIHHYPLINACFYHIKVTCVSFDVEILGSQSTSKEWFPSLHPRLSAPKASSSMANPRSLFNSSYANSTILGSAPQWMQAIKEVGFVFPIPFEDPLLAERQVMIMDGATTGLLRNKNITLQDIEAIHFFDWRSKSSCNNSDEVVGKSFSFTSLVGPEFANHMLVRFNGRRNDEPLGQGVVNLRQMLNKQSMQGFNRANERVTVHLSEGGVFTGQAVLDLEISRKPANLSVNQ